MSAEASDFFAAVNAGLDAAGVAWTRNAALVRGLDYYRHTAFEFVTDRLGAQGTVLGGGRYDGLIENLGGPATPAVGWAAGIERLAMLIEEPSQEMIDVFVVHQGAAAETLACKVLADLRRDGTISDMAYRGNMKKQMSKASASNARYAVVIGDEEVADGHVIIKALYSGEQARLPLPLATQTLADFLFEDSHEFEDAGPPPLSERMPVKRPGSVFWTLPSGKIVDPL